MAGMRAIKSESESPSGDKKRRRGKRPRRRKVGVPAGLAFYATALLSVMSFGVGYVREGWYLGLSVGGCLLILVVLLLNEHIGFYRTRRMRARGARDTFTRLETALLFALLFLGAFMSITAWVT